MNQTIRGMGLPDPDAVFPNEYGTSCYIKNVVTAPNIQIGDYTYYDDPVDPAGFEQNNVLFNYPEFGDRLIIGKFCSIAAGKGGCGWRLNHTAAHRWGSAPRPFWRGGIRRRCRCPRRHRRPPGSPQCWG